ncbi:MAG: hypothetical protein JWQ89_3494 [Devosia sp.]|uniref:hypothetical protein n=1 Tax=Devosia sp. TaxID=1871048 RepID=UPI0026019894|nr:hypothetical protein [Devosia sp.]MDB5541767.1 hypothetical protein [Devosia sp.]
MPENLPVRSDKGDAPQADGRVFGTYTGPVAAGNGVPRPPATAAEEPPRRSKADILASLPQAVPLSIPELAEHRAHLARHRSSAFIRYVPTVAGFRLRPVSLRSIERLAAFECDLRRGRFEDLAIFVWIHHPAFGQFAGLRRRLIIARLRWRLTPAWPRLGAFLVFAGKLCRATARTYTGTAAAGNGVRRTGTVRAGVCWILARLFSAGAWLVTFGRPPTTALRLATALAEARALYARAHTDWPAGDDSGSAAPLPCSFTAFVLNTIKGRHPQLTADEILDWPLVELVQWLRAIMHEQNPRQELIDSTEAALIAAALEPSAEVSPTPSAAGGRPEGENLGQIPGAEHGATGE